MTSWTVAYQAPLSMEFSRQQYWSGLLFSIPGDLPNPGIKPGSPSLQADALASEPWCNQKKKKYKHMWLSHVGKNQESKVRIKVGMKRRININDKDSG